MGIAPREWQGIEIPFLQLQSSDVYAMCYAVTFDVVFALDDSTNVPASGWTQMLTFMSSYLDQFTVGLGNVRVAVVRYSDVATIAFDLNEYRTASSAKTAISQLQHVSMSSQRNLADAFRITLAHLFLKGQRFFAAQVAASDNKP